MEQTPPVYPPVTDQQKLIADATQTASTLKGSGVSQAAIYDILIQKGVDAATAEQIVRNTGPAQTAAKSDGKRDMLIGGLWMAGGLILTIGSYMAVSESGGHYFITYGPIIYGGIRFFKGVGKA